MPFVPSLYWYKGRKGVTLGKGETLQKPNTELLPLDKGLPICRACRRTIQGACYELDAFSMRNGEWPLVHCRACGPLKPTSILGLSEEEVSLKVRQRAYDQCYTQEGTAPFTVLWGNNGGPGRPAGYNYHKIESTSLLMMMTSMDYRDFHSIVEQVEYGVNTDHGPMGMITGLNGRGTEWILRVVAVDPGVPREREGTPGRYPVADAVDETTYVLMRSMLSDRYTASFPTRAFFRGLYALGITTYANDVVQHRPSQYQITIDIDKRIDIIRDRFADSVHKRMNLSGAHMRTALSGLAYSLPEWCRTPDDLWVMPPPAPTAPELVWGGILSCQSHSHAIGTGMRCVENMATLEESERSQFALYVGDLCRDRVASGECTQESCDSVVTYMEQIKRYLAQRQLALETWEEYLLVIEMMDTSRKGMFAELAAIRIEWARMEDQYCQEQLTRRQQQPRTPARAV